MHYLFEMPGGKPAGTPAKRKPSRAGASRYAKARVKGATVGIGKKPRPSPQALLLKQFAKGAERKGNLPEQIEDLRDAATQQSHESHELKQRL